jgi:hypothetical protein
MKRMLLAALASSLLTLTAPTVASAHHGHHHRGHARAHTRHASSARLERFGIAGAAGSTGSTSQVTQASPADETAGKVDSFTGGVLTIKLNDGSTVSGKVTKETELRCRPAAPPADTEDDRGGDDDEGGSGGGDDGPASAGRFGSQRGDLFAHSADSHDGEGDENAAGCSTEALVTNTVVLEAELKLSGSGAVWEQVGIVH